MIADIIVILIIALCIFLGYMRGLIKVAVNIISFVAAIVVALILYNPIANYIINNTEIVPKLENTIQSNLYVKEDGEVDTNTVGGYIEQYKDDAMESGSEFVAKEGAEMAVRIGTWVVLFLVTKVVLLFLKLFAGAIGNLPLIKQFNKLGGTIFGVLQGFVVVYIALAVFSMLEPTLGENGVSKAIAGSHICKTMYENNIILNIIL